MPTLKVNTTIIDDFFNNTDISQHWIFNLIEEGKHCYKKPEREKSEIQKMYHVVMEAIQKFTPKHADFFTKHFPNWCDDLETAFEIFLVVGCPYPYDAMTREINDKCIIILDLNRLYFDDDTDIKPLILNLVTHELFHVLYAKYNPVKNLSYHEKLLRLCFDEGFAHYLAGEEIIFERLDEFKAKYYEKNLKVFLSAFDETDTDIQGKNIMTGITGPFWEKFIAITGLFILCFNQDCIDEIYDRGYMHILEYKKPW